MSGWTFVLFRYKHYNNRSTLLEIRIANVLRHWWKHAKVKLTISLAFILLFILPYVLMLRVPQDDLVLIECLTPWGGHILQHLSCRIVSPWPRRQRDSLSLVWPTDLPSLVTLFWAPRFAEVWDPECILFLSTSSWESGMVVYGWVWQIRLRLESDLLSIYLAVLPLQRFFFFDYAPYLSEPIWSICYIQVRVWSSLRLKCRAS